MSFYSICVFARFRCRTQKFIPFAILPPKLAKIHLLSIELPSVRQAMFLSWFAYIIILHFIELDAGRCVGLVALFAHSISKVLKKIQKKCKFAAKTIKIKQKIHKATSKSS